MTAPQRTFAHAHELSAAVGENLGTSGWVTIDQNRIDRFAQATGDHQWLHTDPVRAARGPFGTTIAHGFLTLSLLPEVIASVLEVRDMPAVVNYGLDKVRFPAPVPVDSRLRGHVALRACQAIEGGVQLALEVSMEREGAAKPVCVAEALIRCLHEPPLEGA